MWPGWWRGEAESFCIVWNSPKKWIDYGDLVTQQVNRRARISTQTFLYPNCTICVCFFWLLFFQIFIFIITSKIIQTLQKGIKGLLLPHPTPASPLPQACTANCSVGVLAGHLLCMHRSPKGARHACLQWELPGVQRWGSGMHCPHQDLHEWGEWGAGLWEPGSSLV